MHRFLASLGAATALASVLVSVPACTGEATGTPPPAVDAGATQDTGTGDAGAPLPDPACQAFSSTIQSGLDAERAKQKLRYATVAVWTERCGSAVYLSNDSRVPAITADHYWRVGSVTKTYVAATTLKLVEQGKLSLDDNIAKWFPDFPRATAITVRQLLNHSSGIYNYTETNKFSDAVDTTPDRVLAPEELIAWANEQAPTNEPGAAFSYSNTNYIVLGRLIELLTGDKVAAALRREVMIPAGLTHTFLDGAETVPGPFARGYAGNTDVTTVYGMSGPWTAGAMAGTPADLVQWVRALYIDKKILGAASFADMTTSFPKASYGLGCQLLSAKVTLGAGPGLGHGGSIFGYQTQATAFPDAKLAIVSIAGDSSGDPNGLSIVALDAFATLRAAP